MIDTPLFTDGRHSAIMMSRLVLEIGPVDNAALATVVKHGGNGVSHNRWNTDM
jgi:hypothetical protein